MDDLSRPRGLTRQANFIVNGVRRLTEVAAEMQPAYMIAINEDHYRNRGRSAYIDLRHMTAAEVADVVHDLVYDYLIREVIVV